MVIRLLDGGLKGCYYGYETSNGKRVTWVTQSGTGKRIFYPIKKAS